MAKSTIYRTGILTTILASLLIGAVVAEEPVADSGLSNVPSNATAFIHLDIVKLLRTPDLAVPTEIAAGVKQETDELFERHFGIRPSELLGVTFVAPTFESLMAIQTNNGQSGFGLFAFAQPVKEGFVDSLPRSWRPVKIGTYFIYVDKNTKFAVFHSSPKTIAFGSEEGIRWFIKNRRNHMDSGLRPAMKLADYGHITVGFNGDKVPSTMKMFVPPEMKSFASAKSAGISLNCSNGIAVRTQMNFDTELDAANAGSFLRQSVEEARKRMKLEETNVTRKLKDKTAELYEAFEPLSMLALIRYGDKILRETQIDQTDKRLEAQFAIEGFNAHMLVITCLTAIQAVGAKSEAEFESIANELSR